MNPELPGSSPNATPLPRQGLAITALVLGIIGMVCLGPFAGVAAIITGHIAHNRSRRNPAEYSGGGMAIAGFVLGYLSVIIGTVVMLMMLATALPALAQAKEKAEKIKCINNLKQLGLAARIYATEHNEVMPPDFKAMRPFLGGSGGVLICPSDAAHTALLTDDWSQLTPANISYEYLTPGAKTDDVVSQTAFRCPIHNSICLGDGSVQSGP